MPSSNSDGMQSLVRREPLSPEDWVKLIDSRRNLIYPYLDKISLLRLGDFQLEGHHDKDYMRMRNRWSGKTDDPRVFEIQGYFVTMNSRTIDQNTLYELTWGLTRDGVLFYIITRLRKLLI